MIILTMWLKTLLGFLIKVNFGLLALKKIIEMEYRKLDPQTDYTYVDMTLYLQDVKVLYNACMDITAQYPEMIGYKKIMDKLVLVIDEFDNTENK